MLLVSNIQANELNFGAQLLMLVFITAKPTSYSVIFQSRKRVQYYFSALEIHSIREAAGMTWHINKGS